MIELKSNIKGMGSYIIKFFNCVTLQNDNEKGLSHLLEHCMCQPIKKYDYKFKENGIQWNASTSNDSITFYMYGLNKNIKKYINVFKQNILNYTITKQVFERQKQIVISEYKQYFSDPTICFILNWFRQYFNTTFSIGLYDNLENITYEQFIKFKNKIFNNNYKIYYIHPRGNKDIKLPFNPKPDYKFNLNKYNTFPIETKFIPKEIKENTVMISNIVSNEKYGYVKNKLLYCLMDLFMHNGLTSYLYKEIRQKTGYVYSISNESTSFKNQIVILYAFKIDKKYINDIKIRIKEALQNIQKHITKKEFKSVIKQFLIQNAISFNVNYQNIDLFNQNRFKMLNMLKNKEITYQEFKEFILNIKDNYIIFTDEEELK